VTGVVVGREGLLKTARFLRLLGMSKLGTKLFLRAHGDRARTHSRSQATLRPYWIPLEATEGVQHETIPLLPRLLAARNRQRRNEESLLAVFKALDVELEELEDGIAVAPRRTCPLMR